MAGASLLTLLDDIASVLDDVALMTKVAAKKTAGVLGDDIALNAQQVSGAVAKRELPIVWAVAKGSFRNKLILVPLALAISAVVPAAITPLLMLGGIFLCYEGVEKIVHNVFHSDDKAKRDEPVRRIHPEQEKIKAAIRTDIILSAEIIAITLGTVAAATFSTQAVVVTVIAIVMTAGVYGFVAGVVKLDDLGLFLSRQTGGAMSAAWRAVGHGILGMAPYLMKGLSVVGTAAMFLVGGGIIAHGVPGLETWLDRVLAPADQLQGAWPSFVDITGHALANALLGIAVGAIAFGIVWIVQRFR